MYRAEQPGSDPWWELLLSTCSIVAKYKVTWLNYFEELFSPSQLFPKGHTKPLLPPLQFEHLIIFTFLVLGYFIAARLDWDPAARVALWSDPVNCLPSPGPSTLLTSVAVTKLAVLPSSGTACASSACWELACFCLLSLCAELVRYREKRLFGRGLEGFAGAGLVTVFSGTAS